MIRPIITLLIFLSANLCAQETVYPIQENGLWGFIDASGAVVIRPQFRWEQAFPPENGFILTQNNSRFGLLSRQGEILFEPQFDQPPPTIRNVGWVQKNEKWGLIDRRGAWVIEPTFDIVYDFIEGYAKFEQNGHYGLVDSAGTILLPPVYYELSNPSEGLIAANDGNGWGYIDLSGKYVIPRRFGNAYDFHYGHALVQVNYNRWRIIDKFGNFTTEKEFDYLGECGENLFYAELGGVKGIVDHTGSFVLKNESCRYYNKNLIQYEENEKIGFKTLDGKIVLKPQFVIADDLGENRIVVSDEKNRMGFIDTLGNILLKPQPEFFVDLTSETRFREGRLVVRSHKKYGVIDREMNWIVKPKYELISSFKNGWAVVNSGGRMAGELAVMRGGKYGFIDRSGREIAAPKFDEVIYFGTELALVRIGASRAYVNKEGKIIWKQP